MEKNVYRKKRPPEKQKKPEGRKEPKKEGKGFLSISLVIFVLIQFVVYSFLAFFANNWYAAMWTLMSFDNLFVTASLVACGLVVISIVLMLVGLIMMLAGKNAGRFLGLVALSISALGSIFLCGVVVFNTVNTHTAMTSLVTLYFLPIGLTIINTVLGIVFLLRSEGLKEHLAYRRKPKYGTPPRPRLPKSHTPVEVAATPVSPVSSPTNNTPDGLAVLKGEYIEDYDSFKGVPDDLNDNTEKAVADAVEDVSRDGKENPVSF